jgi:phosphoglycolate phosphatase
MAERSAAPNILDGIDLLIFDKDGTLIEFHLMWGAWVDALARGIEAASGLRLRDGLYDLLGVDRATGRVHAHGLMAATPMSRIREAVVAHVVAAGASPETAISAVGASWYAPDPVALAQPITDLTALLARLRERVRLFAVATSDDRDPTERTLAALGIDGEMASLACADDGFPSKPAPDPVLQLCARLAVPPDRTDLRMARSAGAARVIAVLTGVGEQSSLEPLADFVLGSIEELAPR